MSGWFCMNCGAYHETTVCPKWPFFEGEPPARGSCDRAALFEFLRHGDENHQAWLREAIDAFFDGRERPAPR